MPLLVGTDGVREDVQVARQPHRRYRPAGRDVRQDALDPRRRDARRGTTCCSGAAPPEGVRPRDAKRALARALVTRFHGERRRGRGRGGLRPRAHRARGARGHADGACCARRRGRSTCPELLADHFGMSRSEARRKIGQGGVRLDGEPMAELDLPAGEPRRPRPPGRQAALPAAADALMAVHSALLRLQTAGEGEIVDLSAGLEGALRSAGVTDGVVTVFVTGSTAAITTMEYEPGGVQDLQEAIERLVPRAPARGRRLRPQPPQPRRQRPFAPARVAARAVAEHPARAREPRARDLAAGGADRLRRPAARARGARPDHGLSAVARTPAPARFRGAGEGPHVGPFRGPPRRAILRCPLREPKGCPASFEEEAPPRKARRSLKTQQHAHLTAGFTPNRLCASRFDLPSC